MMSTAMVNGNGMAAITTQRTDTSIRFSPEQRRVILDTCCGGAAKAEADALIAIAEARGLNPILGECYFVKRYDSQAKRDKWSVQASIDSFRIKAEQTGLYAGQDEPEFEYDAKGNVTVARVRVWRKDWTRPAVGVAHWEEYVQTTRDGNPTRFWAQMPHNQLSKCAEALAMRKAFPAVLSKVYTAEEMGQADNEVPYAPQMEAPRRAPALPQVDQRAFADLCERVDNAETVAALNAIAKDATKAAKSGAITAGNLEALKGAVIRKRSLVGKAPEPSPSAPDPADSPIGDDANEAEAEAMGDDQ